MVKCVHKNKKVERFYQVTFAKLVISYSFRLFIGFLAPCVVFPNRSRIKTENSLFILARNALRKEKQGIFLATVIRELINYELTFVFRKNDCAVLARALNEGSRFLTDLGKRTH